MRGWQEVMAKALRTPEQLRKFFDHPFPNTPYPLLLPLRLAQRIKRQGLDGPLGLQFLPKIDETDENGPLDPIGDALKREQGGIIHRYTNRILLSPTPYCPVACRYCFRKNNLMEGPQHYRNSPQTLRNYLTSHPEVDEVIFTGGDPLMVADHLLAEFLEVLAQSPQVKFIRLHSRTPLMLPERITPEFIQLFAAFHKNCAQVNLVIHINHWSEMDGDILAALAQWRGVGLGLMAQSVLLKGVNDDTSTLKQLFYNLALVGIRPYYLHHPDPTRGAMHFYLPLERGRQLYLPLRQVLPGHVLPHYVIDSPDAQGKVLALEKP